MSRQRLPGEWKGLPAHEVSCGRCGHRLAAHTVYSSGVRCACTQWLRKESVYDFVKANGPSRPEDWCNCPGYAHPSKYPGTTLIHAGQTEVGND